MVDCSVKAGEDAQVARAGVNALLDSATGLSSAVPENAG